MDCKVSSIQVTLDGVGKRHDQTRYLKGKYPTFDKIISNLIEVGELKDDPNFPDISIRMNVDKINKDGVIELKNYIDESPFKDYVYFYFSRITYPDGDADPRTLSHAEYNELRKQCYQDESKGKIQIDTLPTPRTNCCCCDAQNAYVVGHDGSLYKCWEDLNQTDRCVGSLLDDRGKDNPLFFEYMMRDITTDDRCQSCIALPTCMRGGCPQKIQKKEEYPDCQAVLSGLKDDVLESYRLLKLVSKSENSTKTKEVNL